MSRPCYVVTTKTLQAEVSFISETSSVITVPSMDETVMTPSPKGKAIIAHPCRFGKLSNIENE